MNYYRIDFHHAHAYYKAPTGAKARAAAIRSLKEAGYLSSGSLKGLKCKRIDYPPSDTHVTDVTP